MKKEKDTLLIGRKEAMEATHEPAGPRWASLREEEPQRSRFYGSDHVGPRRPVTLVPVCTFCLTP